MNKTFFLVILLLAAFIVPTHAQVKLKGNIKTPDPVQMIFLSYRLIKSLIARNQFISREKNSTSTAPVGLTALTCQIM